MAWTLNGDSIPAIGFQIGDASYPAAVLDLWPRADLEAIGLVWVEPEPAPPPPPEPIRISRIDFRRLLTPAEAARFRLLENAPKVTAEELAAAFDPNDPSPDLQVRVAVEDAIQQWNLLDAGVIELDHADTAQFLQIMGLAGMFGADPAPRLAAILAQQPPE